MKRLTLAIAAVAAIAGASAPASASTTTLELMRMCEGRESVPQNQSLDLGMCAMYIAGMADMHGILVGLKNADPFFCIPEKGLSAEQQIRIFLKFAKENPNTLDKSARIVFPFALGAAFPCKKVKPSSK